LTSATLTAAEIDVERDERDVGRGHTDRGAVELALELRDDETDRTRRAGGGGDLGEGGGAGAVEVAVQRIDQALVTGIGVHGEHVAPLDAESVVQHLDHRGEAVGGAGGVGDHRHRRGQHLVVDAIDDGGVHPVGGGGDQHLARARGEQGGSAFALGEKPGAFERDIHPLERHLGRIALGGDADRPVGAAAVADDERIVLHGDLAGEAAVHAVIAEEVGVGLDTAEIVDRHRLEVVAPAFDEGAQHQPSDPAKPVDGNFQRHVSSPWTKRPHPP